MNREDTIRMAREAGLFASDDGGIESPSVQGDFDLTEHLERFAALVAKHTLANIDPSSFMSWQEGYAAGAAAEREAFPDLSAVINWLENGCDPKEAAKELRLYAAAIRARGQA